MVLKDLSSIQLLKLHRKHLIVCAEITDILFTRQAQLSERRKAVLDPIDLDIIGATAKVFKITREQLQSQSHIRRLAHARWIACYCFRQLGLPYSEITKRLGFSDSTNKNRTIRCKELIEKDPRVSLWIQKVFEEAGA
jgi:chromosomal replication initiation ATPase DnaA